MVSLGEDIKFSNFRFKEVTEALKALKILIIGHETERRYSTVKVIYGETSDKPKKNTF